MARDSRAERAEIDEAARGRTVLTNFEDTCQAVPDGSALNWKDSSGAWQSLTWSRYRALVRSATAGLKALGFRPGEFAAIMSRNRPEHVIADYAVLHARGVPVSLYNTLAPEQVQYIASHCEAVIAIVENAAFLSKFEAVRSQLPKLRNVVVMDPEGVTLDDRVVSWASLLERGEAEDRRDPAAFEEWRRVTPGDLATLIYTSGTTGPPKGVMQANSNVCWMAESVDRYLGLTRGNRHISYLPFAHAFERYVGHYGAAKGQTAVYFCPDPQLLFAYAVEVKPTQLIGVPRVWEKLEAALSAGIQADSDEQRRGAILQAIEVGRKLVKAQQAREEPSPELLAMAERARPVWMAIRSKVGLQELEYGITGAAPINPAVIEFFQALDINLWEGWGMTESTVGATYNPHGRVKNGTVGIADPGVEMKIADDGEVLLRGGNLMRGYYKDPEKTAETIDSEGWLHTGDVGTIDSEGYLRIIDRKKELIITSGGKNISPANLEALLKQHPLVGQAAVIGDRRAYVSALIVLDQDAAPQWARKAGIAFTSLAELAEHPAVRAEIQKAVDETNRHVSHVEGVKRFTILPVEWTAESAELTPTLKLKRRVITEKYAQEIEDMYTRVDQPAQPAQPAAAESRTS
ncbi:MAG TPA: long-chain fatty acid--CoA ligase [Candidatus Dormibacteraeota bacterium]|nr:long-chain fatty acid--CoA ligase [Candidatus Dormibacteraeota bacterium]